MTKSNQNSNYTPSELYQIFLQHEEPSYYARIPSILYHATYITTDENGNTVRKKLSPQAIALYTYLKQLTGDNGKSWGGRDHLAEMTGMSTGKITAAKKELMQPIEQLNGKSFIQIEKKRRCTFTETGKQKKTTYDEISIIHIWPENHAFMKMKKHLEKLPLGIVHNSGSLSQYDSDNGSLSQYDSAPQGPLSQYDTNNNQCNQTHSEKESEACGKPPALPLSFSGDFTDDAEHVRALIDEQEELRGKLERIQCDKSFIDYIFKNWTLKQIKEAAYKMRLAAENLKTKRGKTLNNAPGYLRKILESEYVKFKRV